MVVMEEWVIMVGIIMDNTVNMDFTIANKVFKLHPRLLVKAKQFLNGMKNSLQQYPQMHLSSKKICTVDFPKILTPG